jgi:hypothetical protein
VTRPGPKKNLAASVRAQLMQLSRTRKEDFNFVLTRYAMERLLYRLSQSMHEPTFILKGAMLFTVWSGHPHRTTKDIDLLASGEPDLRRLEQIFRDVCVVSVEDDGIIFDATTVTATRIKEEANYEGIRVHLTGKLGSAHLHLQVDIGFGDAVTPTPATIVFPSMLGSSVPRLRAYPRETVVAEKLEAMVQLGIANSRMKDFFDLSFLARTFEFDGGLLTKAITATFARRGTPIPVDEPIAFSETFFEDAQKKAQWTGFLRRSGVGDPSLTLLSVVADIRAFLDAPLEALRAGRPFVATWSISAWR